MTNCPNCGAPIVSSQCAYCGTVFSRSNQIAKLDELRESLRAENKLLESQASLNSLYAEAINAMRMYRSGVLTMNEARELVGLKRI